MEKKENPAVEETVDNAPQEKSATDKKKDKKSDKRVEATQAEIEALKKKNDELTERLADETDAKLRSMAEFDNYRKRSQREREAAFSDTVAVTVEKFLGVYDNFERALAAEAENEASRKGLEMIFASFKESLEKLGVTICDPVGEQFDPNIHNAVMHIEDESFGENVIAEVFAKGFMKGDKVIRHAMVKVAN